MFDLTKLPQRYLESLGRSKLAEVVGQTENVVAMWIKRGKFPIDAIQKLLEFDPSPLAEIKPLYEVTPLGGKLVILVPLTGAPEPKVMDSLMRLFDKREMAYERYGFNNLSIVRNVLAHRFLRGPWEWSWWNDGDTMCPAGDAPWFKRAAEMPYLSDVFAGVHSIYRALVHKQTIVSCSYVSRTIPAVPQFGGGEIKASRDEIRSGPRDFLKQVPWAGMGGCLVHRSVFEDIIKTQGAELRMKPNGVGSRFGFDYAFFNPLDFETCGDDVPFFHRAGIAGHKVYVDLAIQAAHIGDRAYTYRDVA